MRNRIYFAKKGVSIIVLLILILTQNGVAQLIVTPIGGGTTPQQLVQNILCGTGVTVTNVMFNGSPLGQSNSTYWNNFGSFSTGATPTNLGFNNGLILSSGGITSAVGPNNSSGSTVALVPATPDSGCADLNALVPGSVLHDAAVLEFDFVPESDTIKFRYVFGSDEYNDYVNDIFNDVFGFFITGFNPSGPNYNKYNIALVPGTGVGAVPPVAITINNVNNGYMGNNLTTGQSQAGTGPCSHCAYFIDNTGGTSLQADGRTTVLTAWAEVIPCTTYHLKLALADRGDRSYDSWVWLEANSFSSPQILVNTNYSHPNISSTSAVRGCNDAIIKLKYPHPVAYPTGVPVITQGTAVNGVDYATIPSTVFFATGSDSAFITISPFNNPSDTTTKTVVLIIQTSICGNTDTIIVTILPKPPIVVNGYGDTTVCNINNLIGVTATGGFAPYKYTWNTGDTLASKLVSPVTSTWYSVTVKDMCNQIAKDSVKITINCHFANAGPDTTICVGDTAKLHASGGIKYVWNTLNPADTTAIIKVHPTNTTTYIVTVTNSSNIFTDKDTVVVSTYPLSTLNITPDPGTICFGDSIQLTAAGVNKYLWSSNFPDPILPHHDTVFNPYVQPSITALYRVKGTDVYGCKYYDSAYVNISPTPTPYIQATPNPTEITNPLVYFTEISGTGNTWYWETGDGFTTTQNSFSHLYSSLDTGSYLVKLVMANSVGCIDSTSLWVVVIPDTKFYIPNAFSPEQNNNPTFRPYGTGIFDYELLIYNRWGEQLFYSKDIDFGWDGYYKNEKAPAGVYVYIVSFKNTKNQVYRKTGTVTLIR